MKDIHGNSIFKEEKNGEYEGHGYKKNRHSGRVPPEGWSHIDWEDNSGQKWRDTVPTNVINNIIQNRGMKLKKIIRG